MCGIFISIHWGLFSTRKGFHEYIGSLTKYIEGYHDSYHGMDTMSTLLVFGTLRRYNEYIWGYDDYIKVFSTSRDILSTLQDVQYIGGIS